MSVSSNRNILTYKTLGALGAYLAVVSADTAGEYVAAASANTSKCIGISQSASLGVGDAIEVAISGGGAKAKLSGAVVTGDLLVASTDGTLLKVVTAGDRVIAEAMEDGASGSVISVSIVISKAQGTES